MRTLRASMLVLLVVTALLPNSVFAGFFRRYSRRANTNYVSYNSTSTTTNATSSSSSITAEQVSTAQGVAELMARYQRVGHWGGNPGYEGCGCGPTKESAYYSCCYSNSGMATVDVGYAQDSNGTWYCCRRYN